MFVLTHKEMVVQVEFQSLIGGAKCVNGGAAPPPKSLVRTLTTCYPLGPLE